MTQQATPANCLAALPGWDGTRRLATWMTDYLGVQPENEAQREYISRVGTYFLRGMIKRAMEPGCKFDYCLVLEGRQGGGKSSIARTLAWHWGADTDLNLHSKAALLALPEHWVYEISELGSLMKAEERRMKSFLSRQEDEYRPPYGQHLIRVPRRNVFIGTTNEEEYLKDAPGNRRFWPVRIGNSIDLAGLTAARELLYAEALADYIAGLPCFPGREEEQRLFVPEQAKRGVQVPFEDTLHKWVQAQTAPFTLAAAASEGLGLSAEQLTPAVVTRIGIALKKLGCRRIANEGAADPGGARLYLKPGATLDLSTLSGYPLPPVLPASTGKPEDSLHKCPLSDPTPHPGTPQDADASWQSSHCHPQADRQCPASPIQCGEQSLQPATQSPSPELAPSVPDPAL